MNMIHHGGTKAQRNADRSREGSSRDNLLKMARIISVPYHPTQANDPLSLSTSSPRSGKNHIAFSAPPRLSVKKQNEFSVPLCICGKAFFFFSAPQRLSVKTSFLFSAPPRLSVQTSFFSVPLCLSGEKPSLHVR